MTYQDSSRLSRKASKDRKPDQKRLGEVTSRAVAWHLGEKKVKISEI